MDGAERNSARSFCRLRAIIRSPIRVGDDRKEFGNDERETSNDDMITGNGKVYFKYLLKNFQISLGVSRSFIAHV